MDMWGSEDMYMMHECMYRQWYCTRSSYSIDLCIMKTCAMMELHECFPCNDFMQPLLLKVVVVPSEI